LIGNSNMKFRGAEINTHPGKKAAGETKGNYDYRF
jgi:hypothetical protein